MSSRTVTYSSKNVVFIFGNAEQPSGYDDGDFLKVTFDRSFTVKRGADGETARSATNTMGVQIKLIVMQTSVANATLSAILAADEGTPNGNGVLPFQIKDLGGTTFFEGVAWIDGPPAEVSFGKEVSAREWTFDGKREPGTGIFGGN